MAQERCMWDSRQSCRMSLDRSVWQVSEYLRVNDPSAPSATEAIENGRIAMKRPGGALSRLERHLTQPQCHRLRKR